MHPDKRTVTATNKKLVFTELSKIEGGAQNAEILLGAKRIPSNRLRAVRCSACAAGACELAYVQIAGRSDIHFDLLGYVETSDV